MSLDFSRISYPGDVFVFLIGLIHFHVNVGMTNAVAIAAAGSQNPGLITIRHAFFGSNPMIDPSILAKAFALDLNIDELTLLMSENLCVERSNITASLDYEYSKIVGPERSGRACCLGRGPTPSKLLKMSNTPNLEALNSEVVELKSQVSELQTQV
ncbi:unnamed protein product [Eruca vesicaria subsp. sativa]|uniref:Germin-like protein n=1 Tax=Eruca vesicaria subsp. sativa TaxID=29727 RepID=A0ABC8L095_ERUVS|nr:unnamed protein product [Eruca vesicaria subsp. sativa]